MQRFTSNIARKFRALRQRAGAPRAFIFSYDHVLGTSLELQVCARSARSAKHAEAEVLIEIDRLENILSGWSTKSEFSRWRESQGHVGVSPDLAEVLRRADAWRVITGGAFDPALKSGISLDAIAKGYIVAMAAAIAAEVDGVTDVLLNIGGDVQHFGSLPMVIGVADPFAPAENAPPIGAVRLENAALATSGGYRRGFIANGNRVSHIVDPRTGQPVNHIASASVFAPDCATADALSTAFSVMQPTESIALADSLPDIGCMLVENDGTITTNSAWMDCAVYTHQLRVA
jgi:thiamine biosynthesis lipoprotein